MLRIRDLILPETHDVSELYYHAAQALHVRASDIAALHIFRRSLDARKSRTSAGSTPWTSRSAAVREPCCAAAAAQRSRGRRPMSTAFPAATQRSAP